MNSSNQVERSISVEDNKSLITVDSLTVEYATKEGEVQALRDVSFELQKGETLGIAGESGSGKSTLALAILQYLDNNGSISDGDINFRNESLLRMSSQELRSIRGNEIAHVAQSPEKALNPSLVVGKQIAETIRLHQDVSGNESKERTYEILDSVDISDPEFVFNQYPHELSGGMQQRILIAMALSCDPSVLILDEPSTGLDVTTQAKTLNLINDLKNDFDTSILLITHDLSVISEVADRVAILYAGEIMEQGPVEAVFESPANPYTQGLFASIPRTEERKELKAIPGQIPELVDLPEGCIFADRCEFVEQECRETSIELESVDESHTTRCRRWETVLETPVKSDEIIDKSFTQNGTLLEVENLSKDYDIPSVLESFFDPNPPVKAVNDVNFSLCEGESLALVGESGCGKTTLGRTVLGLLKETEGEISFRGESLDNMTTKQYKNFRSECQIVFQNPDSSLNPRKNIYDIIARPIKLFTDCDEEEQYKRVTELLTQVGLSPAYTSRKPHELSGGEQQRVAIARAFAAEPSFVVLDEPVSSLDVSVQANILNLLDKLQGEYNTSYLFISHDLSVVRHLCDRIAVMYLGEIVEQGSVAAIFEDPKHPYTESLLESVPSLGSRSRDKRLPTLYGEVPSPRDPPTGCKFHTRCPYARETCTKEDPPFTTTTEDATHKTACFRSFDEHEYWSSSPLPHTRSENDPTTSEDPTD